MHHQKELVAFNLSSQDLGKLHRLVQNRGITLELESGFKALCERMIQDQPEFVFISVGFEKLDQFEKKLKLIDDMAKKLGSIFYLIFPKKNMQVLDFIISANLQSRNILFSNAEEEDWKNEVEETLISCNEINDKIKLSEDEVHLRVKVQGSVRRLGELNCVLSSSLFLQGSTPINITSRLFDGLDISYFDLKKISHSYATHENEFLTEYAFRGLPESSAKLIRAQKNKWR
ncbi:hypothetical protein N9N67_02390 [Bacteriovoracaceae bacterium]|nr:hypothetical protein [Bacteriovoracaceae bacterium]